MRSKCGAGNGSQILRKRARSICQKVYQTSQLLIIGETGTKEEILIGIILLAVTIIAFIMMVLHGNDPVYPLPVKLGSKHLMQKTMTNLFGV